MAGRGLSTFPEEATTGADDPAKRAAPRRVLHVLWSMEVGGAERAVYQLVREQRLRGDEADVLLAHRAGLYGERCREAGASVFELGQRSALDLRAAATAGTIVERYDLVHFHNIEPLLIAAALRRRGPRFVYTHRSGAFRYPPRQRLRYEMAGRYVRRFDAVSANTAHAARAAARLFRLTAARVPVTYNGLDFSLLAPRRERQEVLAELGGADAVVRVGTSGMLRRWKRVDRLVRALARLPHEPLQLVVVGDGPARRDLERLAADLGVAHRTAFVGLAENVGDYLQALDAFALPSGPEESFGNAAVEAMGVGLPVVVFTDGGGLTEHVRDGRTGYVVRDEAELALRLGALARDAALRRRLGNAAREAAETRYSLSAMVARYDALYDGGVGARVEAAHA